MWKRFSAKFRWLSGSIALLVVGSNALATYAATIVEGFEQGNKPSYAVADVVLGTGLWNLNEALIGGDTNDRRVGTRATRVRNSGKVTMKFDRSTGAGTVSIKHAKYGTDSNTTWQLWCSNTSGSTWSQVGSTVTTSSTTLQTATFTANLAGTVRCEVRKTDGTANRVNLDDIQITDYGSSGGGATNPFFDTVNNPVSGLAYPTSGSYDMTPAPPTLSTFDQSVTNLCGAPGTTVTATQFQTLMNNYPTVLSSIKTRMGVSSSVSDASFLTTLTNIWFSSAQGFNHVICGEPVAGGAIGGLHFAGRYLQLQNQGLAERVPNNTASEEVFPGAIYTVGAKVLVNGGVSQSSIKGYGYTLSAEDILAVGGRAYLMNPNTTATNQVCNYTVTDDGYTFTTVFVRRNGGVRTFYPDATPSSTNPNCVQ
jgi:Bacterial EndoU nuclease